MERFPIGVGARQGCVMLPFLVNIFMDWRMREMKDRCNCIVAYLFASDSVLLEGKVHV